MKNAANKAESKFKKVMHEFGQGILKSHDKVVKDQKQALAIAFSEARKKYPNYGMKVDGGGFDKPAVKGLFYLDAIEDQTFPGYTFGDDWNGFEVPYFEKAEADKIMQALKGSYKNGTYVFDSGDEDDPDEYEVQTIDTVDGPKEVYAIGAYGWTWSSPEQENIEQLNEGGNPRQYQPSEHLTKEQWEKWKQWVNTGMIDGKKEPNKMKALLEMGIPVASVNRYMIEQNKKMVAPITGAELEKIYTTGTAKELWEALPTEKRIHFLMDHATEFFELMGDDFYKSSDSFSTLTYDTLPAPIRKSIVIHHAQGMYRDGGGLSGFFSKAKKYGKSAFKKSKEVGKKAYEQGKEGYRKAKEYTEKQIHDQKKKIALNVLDETRGKVDTKEEGRHVRAASEIVGEQYREGSDIKRSKKGGETLEKKFLSKDLSGRGEKSYTLTESHIRNTWDLDETDDDDQSLEDFLDNSEDGDIWRNGTEYLENIGTAKMIDDGGTKKENGGPTGKLSPAKKKLLDRINTLKRTQKVASESAQKSIQKKIDVLQKQFDYNPSAKERAMANKGKFALDVPTRHSKFIYKKLWGMKILPRIHTMNGTSSIVVNSKTNLDKAYRIYADLLKSKGESVQPLSKISRKL